MHITSVTPPAAGSSHSVRFYDDEAPLLAEVSAFLDGSLRAGGTAIVIATAAHNEAFRERLSGRLIVLDAEMALATFMVGGWPDADLFEKNVGDLVRGACAAGPLVHAYGEMVAVLCGRGEYDAAVRLEQLWNGLQASSTFALFCAYPWQMFETVEQAAKFQQICREHDHVCTHAYPSRANSGEQSFLRLVELEQQNRVLQAEVERLGESEQSLREREKELSDFVDSAAEGLHRVGADGTILWANKAELAMLGYRWEEYIGRPITDFHADRDTIETILARLQAGETLYDQPARLRCKDGSIKHVVLSSNAFFQDGQLRYTRCFTRDATDRHRLDEAHREREALLAELTAMNEAKDEFLAMLAHELRNPLAPISAAAELLNRAPDDAARVKGAAAVIRRQARHLTALLDELLDVARVTRGLVNLARERVDLRTAVDAALEQAAPLVAARQHRLALELPDGPVYVLGDQKRLVQVVVNMLTNAAKYTPDHGQLALRLRHENGNAVLAVTDNGVGMTPELVSKVFQMFVQGGRPASRSQGGLGVGLALVKSLVQSHDGSIEAYSEGPGLGSRFTVRLPLLAEPEDALRAATAGTAGAQAGRGLRVLVVDDNIDAALTLDMLLSMGGHSVLVAHTAADALRQAAAFAPDACLLDIGLPDLNGKDLARQLRATPAGAAALLVAISGYGQPGDKRDSLAAGFDHHLVKPIDPNQLLALLVQGRA